MYGKKEQKRQKSHGSISHSIPCSGSPGRLRADGSRYCGCKESGDYECFVRSDQRAVRGVQCAVCGSLGEYEIVVSSVSILCQPTVALVDEVVDDRGTREVATEYLEYLYSTEAQKLEAENFYRPLDQEVYVDYVSTAGERVITELPADGKWIVDDIALTDIAHFGGWSEASAKHFADGGVFEAIHEQ